jgi:hypothetical protein
MRREMPVPSLRAESSECKLECLIDLMSVCRQQFRNDDRLLWCKRGICAGHPVDALLKLRPRFSTVSFIWSITAQRFLLRRTVKRVLLFAAHGSRFFSATNYLNKNTGVEENTLPSEALRTGRNKHSLSEYAPQLRHGCALAQ